MLWYHLVAYNNAKGFPVTLAARATCHIKGALRSLISDKVCCDS